MTQRPFSDTQTLTSLLRLAMGQTVMDLHTVLPGVVETYSPTTRRARVIPAISLLLDDGSLVDRPPVTDVPVIFPSGGGLSLVYPLSAGDPVLLVFSQRGLDGWKGNSRPGPPPASAPLSLSDAIALAGFGSLATTPASLTGASLQTDDGQTSVVVEPTGEINIIAGAGPVTIRATQINLLTA